MSLALLVPLFLLGVAGVVGDQQFDRLPEDAASFIDVGDRQLSAVQDLIPSEDVSPGKRTGSRDQDLCAYRSRAYHRQRDSGETKNFELGHGDSLSVD